MEKINFQKFSGSGNDFIIIDNRDVYHGIKNRVEIAKNLCRRKLSIGADGVLYLENSEIADFKMRLFQPDGSEAEMCGNGARCIARFAFINGIASRQMIIESIAGILNAEIIGDNVSIKLSEPFDFRLDKSIVLSDNTKYEYSFVNTGVPHTVIFTDSLEETEIVKIGKQIRFHKDFEPEGTNVNFIHIENNTVKIRTYERGVEGETLACGTGSAAAALISFLKDKVDSPVEVLTKNNTILKIHFNGDNIKKITENQLNKEGSAELFLEGDAELTYRGEVEIES